MRISRVYLPLESTALSGTVCIEGDKAHYIKNVLRLKVGFTLHFFTPDGHQYQCKVSHINKHQVELNEIFLTKSQPENSILNTTLAQGISSSDRMDYSIQKAAELGCLKLIPFISDFCSQKVPVHKYEKKLKHWQAVSISACEQSGRSSVMAIDPIVSLETLTQQTADAIYLDPTAELTLAKLPPRLQTTQTFFIGPEGGFSLEELVDFKNLNYSGIKLGQRVLRTETVAPVIMGAMHALYGDFKPPAE